MTCLWCGAAMILDDDGCWTCPWECQDDCDCGVPGHARGDH